MDKNFGGFAFAHTEADIFIDPTLLLDNVDMTLDIWAVKYIRTFELFEKSSRIEITQGYQKGEWKGLYLMVFLLQPQEMVCLTLLFVLQ